jgi:UDP-glucose 4-epimerase
VARQGISRQSFPVQKGPVLVTGGAGFIGSHLVERLLLAGQSVVVVDDFSTGRIENLDRLRNDPGLRVIHSSVSECLDLARIVEESSYVFHLAAAVGVELVVKEPIRTIQTNLRETERILEAAVASSTPVLLTSTSEVYGRSDKPWFAEEDDLVIGPPNLSRWSYACSKLLDEFLALAFHRERGVPVCIARLFNVVGPRQSGRYGMVLPRFMEAARRGRALQVFGDGRQTRCFCLVEDCVEALVRLSNCPEAHGQVVNVGHDEEISVLELAELVCRTLAVPPLIERIPYEQAYQAGFQDMARRRPDVRKLERLVGFRPRMPVVEIIRRMAAAS